MKAAIAFRSRDCSSLRYIATVHELERKTGPAGWMIGLFVCILCGTAYGAVLTQPEGRQGLYTYTEKMLRGYVRMQAEANGIALSGERPAPRQAMHVGNARSGYRGPSIPRGVRTGKEVAEWDDSNS